MNKRFSILTMTILLALGCSELRKDLKNPIALRAENLDDLDVRIGLKTGLQYVNHVAAVTGVSREDLNNIFNQVSGSLPTDSSITSLRTNTVQGAVTINGEACRRAEDREDNQQEQNRLLFKGIDLGNNNNAPDIERLLSNLFLQLALIDYQKDVTEEDKNDLRALASSIQGNENKAITLCVSVLSRITESMML